jgi:hypothetical protein
MLSDEKGLILCNVIILFQAVSFCRKAVRIGNIIQHWLVPVVKLGNMCVFLYA